MQLNIFDEEPKDEAKEREAFIKSTWDVPKNMFMIPTTHSFDKPQWPLTYQFFTYYTNAKFPKNIFIKRVE